MLLDAKFVEYVGKCAVEVSSGLIAVSAMSVAGPPFAETVADASMLLEGFPGVTVIIVETTFFNCCIVT